MNEIALWIRVFVDDWTAERVIVDSIGIVYFTYFYLVGILFYRKLFILIF